MKKIVALGMITMLCITSTAQAAACYSAREFEAEQGLRIHSELMVIGLTCAKTPGGQQLYADYSRFTQKNSGLIAQYESDIISYYRSKGTPQPEKQLHTLRTNLANKISQQAIKMSTGSFCKHFGPRIQKALSMPPSKIRQWAQHVWPDTPTTEPVCQSGR